MRTFPEKFAETAQVKGAYENVPKTESKQQICQEQVYTYKQVNCLSNISYFFINFRHNHLPFYEMCLKVAFLTDSFLFLLCDKYNLEINFIWADFPLNFMLIIR